MISNAECLTIVRKSLASDYLDHKDIVSFSAEPASSELVGFMGEYYKLLVELRDKRQLSYFIKSVPIANKVHRKECLDKRFFDKETRIYSDLLPNIQKYASEKLFPKTYYTRPDIIVLEDLSNQDLRHITDTHGASFQFFEAVLTLLARLHAGSIAYEHHSGINIGEQFKDCLFELQISMNNSWCVAGIKSIVSMAKRMTKYKGTPMERFICNELYDLLCQSPELTGVSKKYRSVLCHRDTWSRNIFFKCDDATDSPVGCLIVDFQLTSYSPQAIDVLNFLYMTTGRKQRDAIYDKCLDFYYNAFVRMLVELDLAEEAAPKSEFLDSCCELALVPLIMKAISAPLMEMPDGLAYKMRAEEPVRFDYYMNTERDEMYDRIFEIDPTYERAVFEPIEELLEYFENRMTLGSGTTGGSSGSG